MLTALLGLLLCLQAAAARPVAAQVTAPASDPPVVSANPIPEPNTHRLIWNDSWPRFRPIGYVLTGASVAGALAVTFLIKYPQEPHWKGGILFDDAARDLLRARNPGVRDGIRIASNITLATTIVQVAVLDSVLLPLLDRSPDVAAQLTLINAQAFALNIFIATLLFKAVARARPLIQDCEHNPNFDPLCKTGPYASFPSSHASTAFTAAGLTCVHHAYLHLYGGGWDQAACIESIALATATGLFRVMGDRHYMTDVLLGAAIGFSIGYIYPWLLHYRYGKDDIAHGDSEHPATSRQASAVRWSVTPIPYGLNLGGVF